MNKQEQISLINSYLADDDEFRVYQDWYIGLQQGQSKPSIAASQEKPIGEGRAVRVAGPKRVGSEPLEG